MKNKIILAIAVLGIAVLFTSCAKPPQAEIDAANAAIQEAKTVGADLYVPADFAALTDSMNAINAAVEEQKSKMFPSYGKVKEKLAVVSQMAVDTKAKSESRKVEIQNEITQLTTEVTTLMEENKTLVTKAPKGKEGAAAIEAIKSDLALIEASVAEVATLQANGDLIGADDKIKAAKEKATSINTELKDVIEKAKGKKK
jgi:hypothetical protein